MANASSWGILFWSTARCTHNFLIKTNTLSQGARLLAGLKRPNRFAIGLGEKLPAAYRKFYAEWKLTAPTAVHYIPREGQFERDEVTGIVRPVQNIPLPVIYPPEHNAGIWGGEGVIKGFQKRAQTRRRVPHYWVPVLRRTVVHSRILDRHMSVVVTDRTMQLVHESLGFDHYLLKTPACDLKSELALKLKRQMLLALQANCSHLTDDAGRRADVQQEYGRYLEQYTADEIEWYGLTFKEAIAKIKQQMKAQEKHEPHKHLFRSRLLEQLRAAGVKEAQIPEGDGSAAATSVAATVQQPIE